MWARVEEGEGLLAGAAESCGVWGVPQADSRFDVAWVNSCNCQYTLRCLANLCQVYGRLVYRVEFTGAVLNRRTQQVCWQYALPYSGTTDTRVCSALLALVTVQTGTKWRVRSRNWEDEVGYYYPAVYAYVPQGVSYLKILRLIYFTTKLLITIFNFLHPPLNLLFLMSRYSPPFLKHP
jgi:hypothetical protein